MKHLLMAAATAALFASAPAFAQSSPNAAPPVPLPTNSAQPSVTSPAAPGGCAPGQVLQANGQPCAAISLGSTAQAPATPLPSVTATPPAATAAAPSSSTLPSVSSTSTPSDVASAGSSSANTSTFIERQASSQMLASNLMGKSVQNSAGDKIGSVKDVLFDESGQMTAIIIGVGGFLGIGEKSVAIAFDTVKPSKDANGNMILTASLDRDAVNNAPGFMTLDDIKATTPSSVAPLTAPRTP